ncbi:isoprenyl transferase [Alkalibaculum sp. M08DMB]|uniref:Isoprenyl transferase n=1 Tax=Alkalibaculum sporogenes TaxID=2655001 RepID=A0A6A7K9W8_9FIRM|nr:isoprenyl transferase [Alkalibaculum sporogenes]MPW25843.1 isoprenyl transferase [Alkalibaculum sporogenes]
MVLENQIDKNNLPKHIGIIMDGNGRWAQKRLKPRLFGHKAGMESLRKIIRTSSDLGINILTVYAFSTENWKRPKAEVDGLMKLLVDYFNKEIHELNKNKVKIKILGQVELLPHNVKKTVVDAMNLTNDNLGLQLNIAINYGGRDEIIMGIKQLYKDLINETTHIDTIDETLFSQYLYTKGMKDPDLIIRTSGELRTSNFLTWQSAYSELWFTDVLWPDFTHEEYYQAIWDYQKRKRKYGGLKI